MEIDIKLDMTVQNLFDHKKHPNSMLRANPDYQRGLVWSRDQKQMFIDSLFRGYKAPAFYFHIHESVLLGRQNTYFEIIDGQQRIDAVTSYIDGDFPLLDPNTDRIKFPNFVKDKDCPWGGKRFDDLSDNLKQQLLSETVVVYIITANDPNEVRDLFIRLQAGTPLNHQDKRDAWPGGLTEFVLTAGGKKNKFDGWPLFKQRVKISNESKRRQLAAQAFMLYSNKINEQRFVDVNTKSLDEFYHQHIDFLLDSDDAKNFKEICDTMDDEFRRLQPIMGHYILHLILLVSDLQNDFALSSWKDELGSAFSKFKNRCDEAKKANDSDEQSKFSDYYSRYMQWTFNRSDSSQSIQRRHVFFYEKMIELLGAVRKDPVRGFTKSDKEMIFYRDGRQCQYHEMEKENNPNLGSKPLMVDWQDAHIHHVIPHSEGGETVLANGVLVHKDNHRHLHSNAQAVEAFKQWWQNRKQNSSEQSDNGSKSKEGLSKDLPPDGTELRVKHRSVEYHGVIRDRKIHVSGQEKPHKSFSGAGKSVTKRETDGWRVWQICLPDTDKWMLADEWRKRNSR